jgi:hypothetical protein
MTYFLSAKGWNATPRGRFATRAAVGRAEPWDSGRLRRWGGGMERRPMALHSAPCLTCVILYGGRGFTPRAWWPSG